MKSKNKNRQLVQDMIYILKSWKNGKAVEYYSKEAQDWLELSDTPVWDFKEEVYRVKPSYKYIMLHPNKEYDRVPVNPVCEDIERYVKNIEEIGELEKLGYELYKRDSV
jgi:hypothetical protein